MAWPETGVFGAIGEIPANTVFIGDDAGFLPL